MSFDCKKSIIIYNILVEIHVFNREFLALSNVELHLEILEIGHTKNRCFNF